MVANKSSLYVVNLERKRVASSNPKDSEMSIQ